jgi:hypothetical protein
MFRFRKGSILSFCEYKKAEARVADDNDDSRAKVDSNTKKRGAMMVVGVLCGLRLKYCNWHSLLFKRKSSPSGRQSSTVISSE